MNLIAFSGPRLTLIFLVSVACASPAFASPSTVPSAEPSSTSSALPVSGKLPASGAAAVPDKVSPYERNRIRIEFKRAQANELRALEHRHGLELRDLKASQAVRLKEWETKETDLRHKFFADNPKSPDRRTYVKEFIDRRKAFLQILFDERNRRTQEQKVRQTSVRDDQLQRLKEFEAYLQKGERPPTHLWPRPGG